MHKARLFDGREVAVKVQYIGLETAVAADFTTLTVLASAAARWFPNILDFGCGMCLCSATNQPILWGYLQTGSSACGFAVLWSQV